jgi:uncharacterized protein YndB with AHSA1/START domain
LGQREYELVKEVDLNATPEEVWAALTTGPGLASWLFGDYEVVPGEGGSFRLTVGDFVEESDITGWDPPRRLTVRGKTAEDGSYHAFVYEIEAIEGGTARLRFVQSGFLSDSWSDEYEVQTSYGWDGYFRTLNEYLTYFRGRTAQYLLVSGTPGDPFQAYAAMAAALGLPAEFAEGDQVRIAPAGFAPVDGVIDMNVPGIIFGVRSADVIYRFLAYSASVAHHDFTPNLDRAAATEAWRTWLAGVFPPSA